MERNEKDEARQKCSDILRETLKDPKNWFADYLETEEVGNIVRVYVTLGGPTIWWSFNRARRSGRLFYHHGSVLTFKNFGRKAYEKLMQFVY